MSQEPAGRFDEIPILADLRARLNDHYRRASTRRRGRLLRTRRGQLIAVFALLVLGGATAALAAAGVFGSGASYGARGYPESAHVGNGVAATGSVHLLAISFADPEGGPPWGLRIEHTTRGLVCLAVGRLDHGTIGALGIDGAFGNDHLFHPLAVNTYEQTGCTTTDRVGHAFLSVETHALPANAMQASCSPLRPTAPLVRRLRIRIPSCRWRDVRDLYYGLLGPDAVSITYTAANGMLATEKTVGNDGAYLIVAPAVRSSCQRNALAGVRICGGGGNSTGAGLPPGLVRSVSYDNGRVCKPGALLANQETVVAHDKAELRQRFPLVAEAQVHPSQLTATDRARVRAIVRTRAFRAFSRRYTAARFSTPHCPPVGRVAPVAVDVTTADVATPIHARVGKRIPDCGRVRGHHICGWPELAVSVTFRSRVAITDVTSHFELTERQSYAGPCRYGASGLGSSQPSARDLRKGQLVHVQMRVVDCPSVVRGWIIYDHRRNHGYHPVIIPGIGVVDGVLVGRFTVHTT